MATDEKDTGWRFRLRGSGGPGYTQRVFIVPPEVQARHDEFLGHVMDCRACRPLDGCRTGAWFRQTAREAMTRHGDEHGRTGDDSPAVGDSGGPGVTRLFHGPPITQDELTAPALRSGAAVCEPCLLAATLEFDGPHACAGTTTAQAVGRVLFPSVPRPCPCVCQSPGTATGPVCARDDQGEDPPW